MAVNPSSIVRLPMGFGRVRRRLVRWVLSVLHDETLMADVAMEGPNIMSAASATRKARGQSPAATGTDERRNRRGDGSVNLRGLLR